VRKARAVSEPALGRGIGGAAQAHRTAEAAGLPLQPGLANCPPSGLASGRAERLGRRPLQEFWPVPLRPPAPCSQHPRPFRASSPATP
jgi:hypothetical protein